MRLAKEAAENCAWVALDIGSTGKLLKPYGDLDFEDAYAAYAEQIEAGTAAGADLIVIETMSDIYETKAALLAAKEHSTLPVLVSLTFDESGKLLTGADIPAAAAVVEGLGANVIGLNCGLGPKQMLALLPQLRAACSPSHRCQRQCRAARGGRGADLLFGGTGGLCRRLPRSAGGRRRYCGRLLRHHTGAYFRHGARLPRLHCRTAARAPAYAGRLLHPYRRAWPRPLIIGERLNPTGKKL